MNLPEVVSEKGTLVGSELIVLLGNVVVSAWVTVVSLVLSVTRLEEVGPVLGPVKCSQVL